VPRWTKARADRARRRADGTFRIWTGGRTLASLPKKQNNFHGIAVHIGKAFAKANGRPARTGDVFRWKNNDGTYNAHAWWYVKTPHGWRKSPTAARKPTPREVAAICRDARPGT
jgi:hypothetical protein